MSYVKVENGEVVSYPYSLYQLKQDNPNTSFPESISSSILLEYGVLEVVHLPQPGYDYLTEKLTEETEVTLVNGSWCVGWSVVALTKEEKVELKINQENQRSIAYATEADPLFFQWQAEEATKEEWLAKRQEIRDRYPYPEEI
jgi:hypothetical protein